MMNKIILMLILSFAFTAIAAFGQDPDLSKYTYVSDYDDHGTATVFIGELFLE